MAFLQEFSEGFLLKDSLGGFSILEAFFVGLVGRDSLKAFSEGVF